MASFTAFSKVLFKHREGKVHKYISWALQPGEGAHLARSSRSWGNHTSGSMQHPAPHQGLLASKYSMLEGCRITGQGAFSNHLFPRFACLKERSEHSQLRACISKASPAPAGTRLFCTSCYKCKFGGGYFVPLFLLCFHLP